VLEHAILPIGAVPLILLRGYLTLSAAARK
jgi:hypothetical protein